MITNGENEIVKLVCVDSKGNVGSPCGACREYLMQLDKNSKNIEILKNEKTEEYVKLEDLIPDWWGYDRVSNEKVFEYVIEKMINCFTNKRIASIN